MKTMKFLAFFFCSVLVIGCTKDNDEPTENTDGSITITVDLPDGWVKVQGSVLEHQYKKGTASLFVKNESSLDGKDLVTAVNDTKIVLQGTYPSAVISDAQSMKIDGNDALSITYTYSVEVIGITMNMKMQSVYTMVSNKCYEVSIGDSQDNFDNLATDILAILNGIRFIRK